MWINLLKTSKPWYLKSRDKFDVNSQRSSTRYVVALSLSLNAKCKRRENSSNVNCYCAREIFFPRIIFHNFQLHCFDCNVKRRKWNEILGKKLCPRFLLSLSPPAPVWLHICLRSLWQRNFASCLECQYDCSKIFNKANLNFVQRIPFISGS